jgi:thiosulfate dehydrogenase [quinone] large subunit
VAPAPDAGAGRRVRRTSRARRNSGCDDACVVGGADVSQVPANSATTFNIPSSGDPGVLVHLNNGQFVAYDAVCTHAGCTVQYDTGSQMLLCPCHGAAFDPAHNAAVVQGPTDQPLTSVPIHVDNTSGAITLAS